MGRTILRTFSDSGPGTYPDRTVFTGVTVSKAANSDIITVDGVIDRSIGPYSRIKVADDDNDFDYREIKELSQDRTQIILMEATPDEMVDVPLIVLLSGTYNSAQLGFNFQDGPCQINQDYANGDGNDGRVYYPTTFHNGYPMVIDPINGPVTLVVE